MPNPNSSDPSRAQTDKSLRDERDRSDAAFAEARTGAETEADAVLNKARQRADNLLSSTRAEADATSAGQQTSAQGQQVEVQRASEDAVVAKERAAADALLHHERAERRFLLQSILSGERAATDRHLATERLRADEGIAARSDFLAMVSHDAQSLLLAMSLSATSLAEELSEQPSLLSAVERISTGTQMLRRLLGDLVDLASIESGRFKLRKAEVDLKDIVLEAVEVFRPLAMARGISLTRSVPESSLPAVVDAQRVAQVIGNLLANAVAFAPASGGKVSLGVEAIEGEYRLTVSDNGCGIPSEEHEAIFERFRTIRSRSQTNSGLGLFISRSIVAAHHGQIWVESAPEQGTQFTFTLPVASQ